MTTALTIIEVLYDKRYNQVFCFTYFGINICAGDLYDSKGRCKRFVIGYRYYAQLVGENMNGEFAQAIKEINDKAKASGHDIQITF